MPESSHGKKNPLRDVSKDCCPLPHAALPSACSSQPLIPVMQEARTACTPTTFHMLLPSAFCRGRHEQAENTVVLCVQEGALAHPATACGPKERLAQPLCVPEVGRSSQAFKGSFHPRGSPDPWDYSCPVSVPFSLQPEGQISHKRRWFIGPATLP